MRITMVEWTLRLVVYFNLDFVNKNVDSIEDQFIDRYINYSHQCHHLVFLAQCLNVSQLGINHQFYSSTSILLVNTIYI